MTEIVIKIPESEIPKQQDIIEIPLHFIDGKVCEVGGYEFDVLPKGHGRIIDESKINRVYTYTEEAICKNIKAINTTITHTDAPTIIGEE